jgi:simple sugar transport system ATP-binding protein
MRCAPEVRGLRVAGDRGDIAVDALDLTVRAGEIVGIAGVSGNGQRELMAGTGRPAPAPAGAGAGQTASAYARHVARRAAPCAGAQPARGAAAQRLRAGHERGREHGAAPLRPRRRFARAGWLPLGRALREQRARTRSQAFTRARHPAASARPSGALSGGNVQRAVLARELSSTTPRCCSASNPSFGLDFTGRGRGAPAPGPRDAQRGSRGVLHGGRGPRRAAGSWPTASW